MIQTSFIRAPVAPYGPLWPPSPRCLSPDQQHRPATQYAWPRVLFRRGPLVVQKEGINDDQLGSWWIWRLSTWYVLVFGDFNGLHHAIPTNAYFDWKGECWTLMNHGIWGSYYFQTNSSSNVQFLPGKPIWLSEHDDIFSVPSLTRGDYKHIFQGATNDHLMWLKE